MQYIKVGEAGLGNGNGAHNSDGRADGTEDPNTNYTGPTYMEGDIIFGTGNPNSNNTDDPTPDNNNTNPNSNGWTPNYGNDIYPEDEDPEPEDDGRVANDWVPNLPTQEDMQNIIDAGNQIANDWTPDPEPEDDGRVANDWVPIFD